MTMRKLADALAQHDLLIERRHVAWFYVTCIVSLLAASSSGFLIGFYTASVSAGTERVSATAAFAAALSERDRQIDLLNKQVITVLSESHATTTELRSTVLALSEVLGLIADNTAANKSAARMLDKKINQIRTARTAPVIVRPPVAAPATPAAPARAPTPRPAIGPPPSAPPKLQPAAGEFNGTSRINPNSP